MFQGQTLPNWVDIETTMHQNAGGGTERAKTINVDLHSRLEMPWAPQVFLGLVDDPGKDIICPLHRTNSCLLFS